MAEGWLSFLWRIACTVWSEIVYFWLKNFWAWWTQKTPRELLLDNISNARVYEEWIAAAQGLDVCLRYDDWRRIESSRHYNHKLIKQRLEALDTAEDQGDILDLVTLIRSGLLRNLGNITASPLYNRAYAGTKLLIESYVRQVERCIELLTNHPTSQTSDIGWTNQMKLNTLHDTRQAYGRSALVLQGGAIFGLCHLGVVKALHLRGLLPRVISGTATGALIAALVGVHTESELLDVLSGNGINIEAFTKRVAKNGSSESSWYRTLVRRINRWWTSGHFLNVQVLEDLLQANIGDMTFEEAYERTRRVLNITVTTSAQGAVPSSTPTLLNYITAPNVLIRSAALASNATSSSTLYDSVTILCKNENDDIIPWPLAMQKTFQPHTHAVYRDQDSPLHRMSALFQVNHFIVSQARPYLAPFLRRDLHHPDPREEGRWKVTMPILRLVVSEAQHRLRQADRLGLLPLSIRRFLLDENVPHDKLSLTIVPELRARDFIQLLENPTKEAIDYWIRKGERSVWPAVAALNIRCGIEIALDQGYQKVRRRRT